MSLLFSLSLSLSHFLWICFAIVILMSENCRLFFAILRHYRYIILNYNIVMLCDMFFWGICLLSFLFCFWNFETKGREVLFPARRRSDPIVTWNKQTNKQKFLFLTQLTVWSSPPSSSLSLVCTRNSNTRKKRRSWLGILKVERGWGAAEAEMLMTYLFDSIYLLKLKQKTVVSLFFFWIFGHCWIIDFHT
jgi:hypothetical protein